MPTVQKTAKMHRIKQFGAKPSLSALHKSDTMSGQRKKFESAQKDLEAAMRAGDAKATARLREIVANLERTLSN